MFSSCSQNNTLGPGYSWELFKNTPTWDLAKAVAKQDTAEIYSIIKKGNANINFQEPKFKRTLLMLAVGNDKYLSTMALLKMGADVNVRDTRDDQAIHEAISYINLKEHSYDILKLLIEYHCDVNSVSMKGTNYTPLAGAIENLSCAKLLLDNGADPYQKSDSTYDVWFNLLALDNESNENIYVAQYMIIDKKLLIPNPIFYTGPNIIKPRTVFDLLDKDNTLSNTKRQETKEKIIEYLHQINFPKNQVYKEK